MIEFVLDRIGKPDFHTRLHALPRKGDHIFLEGGGYVVTQVQHNFDKDEIRVICGAELS